MPISSKKYKSGLMWFRRDLRITDNAALYYAAKQCDELYGVFVLDKTILQHLNPQDRRISFIYQSLVSLKNALRERGGTLIVKHDYAENCIPLLAQELSVQAIFCNKDYEPQAINRDHLIHERLKAVHCDFHTYKDQVIFEEDEILTQAGKPYTVFTPYKNAWLKKLTALDQDFYFQSYPDSELNALQFIETDDIPNLNQIGFIDYTKTDSHHSQQGGSQAAYRLLDDFDTRLHDYHQTRDFPAIKGPSYLSTHLRFGTISIRHLVQHAMHAICTSHSLGAQTWLSELIWRDFYFGILYHFPHVTRSAFKPEYDAIQWEQGKQADIHFDAWCNGCTGYPLVDAAMRQLNQTGYMHNRLRMLTASFLVKDLGIDWRWGEKYFAQQLMDFDLSANNGGWQWAASTGCDAQPYFRIFNPITQSKKFDNQGFFIRRYVPEIAALSDQSIHAPWLAKPIELASAHITLGKSYPHPVVQHDTARIRTLDRYAAVKKALT